MALDLLPIDLTILLPRPEAQPTDPVSKRRAFKVPDGDSVLIKLNGRLYRVHALFFNKTHEIGISFQEVA